jgi:hypothetical protein
VAEHALDNAVEHEERRLRIRLAPEHVEDRRDVGEREPLPGLVHGSFPDVSSSRRSGDCPAQRFAVLVTAEKLLPGAGHVRVGIGILLIAVGAWFALAAWRGG